MKEWIKNKLAAFPRPAVEADDYQPMNGGASILNSLQDLGRWDELAAEVSQEGQARVAIAGLPQSGKRMLLNRLRGWDLTSIWSLGAATTLDGVAVESFGSFVVADLVQPAEGTYHSGDELLIMLGDPALVVYVLDATRGILPADYRWVALLRSGGRPVLVALNRADECEDPSSAASDCAYRLGATVLPISAVSGLNVEDLFLPALLNAVPRLAVPLGREIRSVRQLAARRVVRQASLFAGVLGAQPIPLLDLPFQVMLQSGMVMRVGASFGYAPGGGLNREIMATVAGSLALHYLAQTVVKFVPFLGSIVGGALAALSTMLIGEAAIQYYAAGCTIPLRQWVDRPKKRLRARRHASAMAETEPDDTEESATMVHLQEEVAR